MSSRPSNSLTKNLPEDSIVRINPIEDLISFAEEREAIRLKKESGQSRPWTLDPILDKYKFTNVRREYDKVSVFIFNWVQPVLNNKEDLLLNLLFARHVNKPSTLDYVGLISMKDDPKKNIKKIQELTPMFANPYQCPAQYKTINGYNKREEWIFEFFPQIVSKTIPILTVKKSIQQLTDEMATFWNWNNGFASMQALLDLGHLRPDLVDKSSEINPGPGAIPALNLLGKSLSDLLQNKKIKEITGGYANVEHLLCEWRKYIELKYGIRKLRKALEYTPQIDNIIFSYEQKILIKGPGDALKEILGDICNIKPEIKLALYRKAKNCGLSSKEAQDIFESF